MLVCMYVCMRISNDIPLMPIYRGTLVRKILQRNKDLLEIRLEKGPTALHIAAINDHVEAVDILIKQVRK